MYTLINHRRHFEVAQVGKVKFGFYKITFHIQPFIQTDELLNEIIGTWFLRKNMFSGEADFEIGEYVNKQKYSIYIHYECFVYIMVKWCNLSELFGKC